MTRMWLGVVGFVLVIGSQQGFGEPKVAVVNVPAVSEHYNKTADLEASFDQTRRQLSEQRDALQGKIDRLGRSLQEELQPGTPDFRARRKELALLEAEMQYFIESKGAEIEQGLAESLRAIYDDIHAMVQVVAEDRGIDIVLAADQMPNEAPQASSQVRQQILLQKVLYWSPRVDLTDDVVARLNAKYEAGRKKTSSGAMNPGDSNERFALLGGSNRSSR